MSSEWMEVSVEGHHAWRMVFNAEPSVRDLESKCPVCGQTALHRWYVVDPPLSAPLQPADTDGPYGRLWEWCSSCLRFEHFMDARVPAWWKSVAPLGELEVRYDPGPIEAAMGRSRHGANLAGAERSPLVEESFSLDRTTYLD